MSIFQAPAAGGVSSASGLSLFTALAENSDYLSARNHDPRANFDVREKPSSPSLRHPHSRVADVFGGLELGQHHLLSNDLFGLFPEIVFDCFSQHFSPR